MYYGSYSLPTYVTVWNARLLWRPQWFRYF